MRRAAVLAALVLAGCGGSDGGGDAAEREPDAKAQYAQAVDGFCSDVSASVDRVQTQLSQAQTSVGDDPEKAAEAVGTALTAFAGDIERAVGELRGAEVPADYRRFHDRAVGGLGEVATALDRAGAEASDGDVGALASLGSTLQGIEVPEPPAELRRRAPACQELSRRRAG
jgi:hypothetical protein